MYKSPLKLFKYDLVIPTKRKEDEDHDTLRHPDAYWVFNKKPPLFWEPLSAHSIETKLANMKAALLAGADPNEMDHEPDNRRSYGRPLHCVVHSNGPADFMKENIPLIKLLLEHGADPRLPSPKTAQVWASLGTPLFHVEQLATIPNQGLNELFECGFYQEAHQIMKKAADGLDSRDAAKKRREFVGWVLSLFNFGNIFKFLSVFIDDTGQELLYMDSTSIFSLHGLA